jgi:hypothetical protein
MTKQHFPVITSSKHKTITTVTWQKKKQSSPYNRPRRPRREVQIYISTISLTSALDRGGLLTSRPGRFTVGKQTRYPLYRRSGGPQGRSERVRKISPSLGFDPRSVQPIASRYTDWAIPTHITYQKCSSEKKSNKTARDSETSWTDINLCSSRTRRGDPRTLCVAVVVLTPTDTCWCWLYTLHPLMTAHFTHSLTLW